VKYIENIEKEIDFLEVSKYPILLDFQSYLIWLASFRFKFISFQNSNYLPG
jgi:hypothetical protein